MNASDASGIYTSLTDATGSRSASRMRVVIDTDVFISAAIKAQTVPNIAVYRAAQHSVLLKSRSTETEPIEVIDRPYLARAIAPAARAWLLELMALAELVSVTERIAACAVIRRMTSFLNSR